MATGGRELTSDEIPSIKCCACNEKGLTRDAEKYCVECCKYYCSTCLDLHSLFPTLKLHQFLDNSSFGIVASDKDLPCFPTERCSTHSGKIVDLYCQDHDEVACASCIAVSHRLCSHIRSIPENIAEIYRKEELEVVKEKLNNSKTKLEEIKTFTLTQIKDLKKSHDDAAESVRSFRQEIDRVLDSLQQNTMQNLNWEFEKINIIFKEKLQEAERMLNSIAEVAVKLRTSAGNDAQEFVCSKISAKSISDTDEFERQHRKRKMAERVQFNRSDNVVSFLQHLTSLGETNSVSAESKKQENKSVMYEVKKETKLDMVLPKDTRICNISGSCITEDGCLLLADYNNNKLKRVDISTDTVKDWLDLQASPQAVCSISTTEIAVTLDNKSVQFVSLGDILMPSSTPQMNHNCFGLAYIEGKLFISDFHSSVYMYNISGQQLQQMSSKDVFSDTRHIIVSDAGDRVYVADFEKGLVIYDSAGKHLSTVTDPAVSGCRGVCTDGRNIFVSGYSSNNIVQIGQDLKVLGEVAKVLAPRSLCFDRQRNRLIVTGESNKITILEVQ